MPAAAAAVTNERLTVSRAPAAELAAAAIQARTDGSLDVDAVDYIVVAVPRGESAAYVDRLGVPRT